MLRIPRTYSASPRTYSASPRTYSATPHILRSAVYVRGYGDGVFQAPRTYYASLRMYGVTEIASSRRPAHTTFRCVCTGLQRWRLPGTPHILRSAAYVRGYGNSVFQTHGAWAFYPRIHRTYYAPLCMYGVTEIASSSHPAHTPLRYVCTGLQR